MSIARLLNSLLAPLRLKLSRLPRPDAERTLYESRYGAESVRQKRFYNIGAGAFRHPFWSNVDMPSKWYTREQNQDVDVAWDISSLQPLAVANDVAEVVYTSHTIEHLLDAHDRHLFAEAYRILKPGGLLRVTCPDIRLYYEVCNRKDTSLLYSYEPGYSFQDHFLCMFATQLTGLMRSQHPDGASSSRITDEDVDRLFDTLPFDDACNHISALCNYELQKKVLGAHINWWHYEKVERFLHEAGFRNIRRSAYGQSFSPVLRNTAYFDNTSPDISLYVEAEK